MALDDGFFRSRWDKISDAQRAYLRAMAFDNDEVSLTKDISTRLNLEPTALSPRRAELIKKGLIYAPRTGEVAFTVPLMAGFIQRQAEE
jgi:Mn-dependent DtxR family transcriptional regulator